jgi:hypothetical protein
MSILELKMTMKRAILSAAVAVLFAAGLSASTAPVERLGRVDAGATLHACSLQGLWLGRARNKDGVGMWLEFEADGTVERAQGRIVDGGYTIKGDTLVLNGHVSVPAKGAIVPGKLSQKVSFKVAGTEMTRLAEQASVEAMMDDAPLPSAGRGAPNDAAPPPVAPIADLTETRLTRVKDGSGGDPLSGVWTFTSKSGRMVLERFSGRGRFAMLEPMGGQKGTYTLEDNNLSVTTDGSTSAVNVICTDGIWLTIDTPNGPMRFLKFQ